MEKSNEEYRYEIVNDHIRILRCFVFGGNIKIPENIEGYPVTEIGDYAFSEYKNKTDRGDEVCGECLLEIIFPETLRRIERYAFYGCSNLERIEFYSSISDIGAGAFTGCHKVKEMTVHIVKGKRSCLRELLMELREKQHVVYVSGEGMADLIFPEFFEEAVENTPARILETHTHGSGIWYRNCFVQTELQFEMYDNRFPWAREDEKTEVVLQMAFGRLLHPLRLTEKSKKQYEKFLKEMLKEAAAWTVENRDKDALYYLAENVVSTNEEISDMIELAKNKEAVEEISILMDIQHERFGRTRKKSRFEL